MRRYILFELIAKLIEFARQILTCFPALLSHTRAGHQQRREFASDNYIFHSSSVVSALGPRLPPVDLPSQQSLGLFLHSRHLLAAGSGLHCIWYPISTQERRSKLRKFLREIRSRIHIHGSVYKVARDNSIQCVCCDRQRGLTRTDEEEGVQDVVARMRKCRGSCGEREKECGKVDKHLK